MVGRSFGAIRTRSIDWRNFLGQRRARRGASGFSAGGVPCSGRQVPADARVSSGVARHASGPAQKYAARALRLTRITEFIPGFSRATHGREGPACFKRKLEPVVERSKSLPTGSFGSGEGQRRSRTRRSAGRSRQNLCSRRRGRSGRAVPGPAPEDEARSESLFRRALAGMYCRPGSARSRLKSRSRA